MAVPTTSEVRDKLTSSGGGMLEIFNGWKDIAGYLKMGVRTAQRYEREFGLPVRRPSGKPTGSVIATKAELDGWIAARPIREAFRLAPASPDAATPLSELRWQLNELRRLREETMALRREVAVSLQSLQTNLRLALPQQVGHRVNFPEHRLPAEVLSFDPKHKVS